MSIGTVLQSQNGGGLGDKHAGLDGSQGGPFPGGGPGGWGWAVK